MSQCVPSWDIDYSAPPRANNFQAHSNSTNSLPFDVPSLDYEQVAELTWENGQLAMHGLAATRLGTTKPSPSATWDKPRAGGTLESIVNQATTHHHHHHKPGGAGEKNVNELVPWFDHHRAVANPAAARAMDALVPCNNNRNTKGNNNNNNNNNNMQRKNTENQENTAHVVGPVPHVLGCSTLVGSCSGAGSAVDGGNGGRVGYCKCGASESATGRLSRRVTVDNNTYSERELGGGGLTSTSLWSPENTSSGGEYTRTSAEEHDSVCHSRSQANGDRKKKATGKSSASTKSRAAAIHNQSERKRRDKINQRMKTLQKMVPNSSKTDKASMLDEVIEYLKQLQAQVHLMNRMNMPSMMMPLAMQQLQMSMMAPAAMGMGMGVMDMANMGRAPGMPPTSAFVPVPSWDIQGGDRPQPSPAVMPDPLSAFLACQSQPNPMTMDAYSRLAALYQQFQQPPTSGPKN